MNGPIWVSPKSKCLSHPTLAQVPTQTIFEDAYQHMIQSAVDGFNVTMFAYGQTGAGKTHTMAGTEETPGIIPLSVKEVFKQVRDQPTKKFSIKMSIMEIYEEKTFDLLNQRRVVTLSSETVKGVKKLKFRNLEEVSVTTEDEVFEILERGMAAKTMAANYKHDKSSRSHTVFRLGIETAEVTVRMENFTNSALMLVDLAGCEAAHQNDSIAGRAQGISINRSIPTPISPHFNPI
jgi:centromeric protein E